MKTAHFKKILLALALCTSFLYAEEVSTPTASANTVLENNTYIQEMPSQSSCTFACPTMKEGYFARIRDVIPSRGETQCFVYKATDPSTILGYVSVPNEQCKTQFNLTDSEKFQVNRQTPEINEFGLESLEKKYAEHFTNVGSGREYLRTSKYVIAGLTADSEILDIPNTLLKNELVLNSGYTIYPNANALPDVGTAQKILDTLGGWVSGVVSFVSGEEIVKEKYKGYTAELSSLNEVVFSNVIVLILNWLKESNEVLLDMNSTLFFFVVPFTAGFFLLGKATKALGDKQDHEDNFERVFLTFIILFVFYFSSSEVNVQDEKKITQTNFQTWSRPILYEGVEMADKLTFAFTKAYVGYKAKDAGLIIQDEYGKIHDQTKMLIKENEVLEKEGGMIGTCYQVYDTDRLYALASEAVGANTVFPPLGSLNKDRRGKPNSKGIDQNFGISNLEETSFMHPQYRRATHVPTLSACYNFERRYKENKKVIEANQIIMKQYESAINSNKTKEGIKLVAELLYKNTAEMGFINASSIASTNILINNLDLFVNADIKEASVEKAMELDNQISDRYEKSNIVSGGHIFAGMRWIAMNSAYMMVPPASSIKTEIVEPSLESMLYLGDKFFHFSKQIGSYISGVGTMGVSFIAEEALKKLETPTKNLEDNQFFKALISFIALIITILIMQYLLAYMPLVAISVAGYLAIGFYYVTVEIFYLVSPFVAIYALSNDQMQVLKSFFSRFLALAFKPVLIVVSIIMAIMANELFDKLAMLSSHKTFDTFFAITQYDRTAIDTNANFLTNIQQLGSYAIDFSDYGLLFFKGTLLVGAKVVSLLAVFYLVFYGSTMVLNIFGMKDSGIDAQDTVGNSIESKSSKYSTSM
ncbi:hypothetical protein [Sulfurospirillum barnesii]|uniref:Uncharacterized protein n=1 Tax=Sulfurospirillum barnesii (strain ATCC 700032 / DSM 10660 / SES-3) TaxID=760154 RepID=I3XX70_SULBS|nr:hypothetical protein [Sulfurospirillum barnesii]AFL68544.1 hypothetical protein Sulba_1250 [Sulfurospirillum barnesii SES-3]